MSDSPYLPNEDSTPSDEGTPFSFKLILVLTAVYLLWRLVEGIIWVAERIGS